MVNGELENTKKQYEIADKLDQLNPLPAYSLGVVEESKGNFKAAISYYEQFVARAASFENGYFNLAVVYTNNMDFVNANENILKVIALNLNAGETQEMRKHIINYQKETRSI